MIIMSKQESDKGEIGRRIRIKRIHQQEHQYDRHRRRRRIKNN